MHVLLGVLAIVGMLVMVFVALAWGAGYVERQWDKWEGR